MVYNKVLVSKFSYKCKVTFLIQPCIYQHILKRHPMNLLYSWPSGY